MAVQDPGDSQTVSLEQWQETLEEKIRVITRSLIVGCLIIVLAVAYTVWRNYDLSHRTAETSKQTAVLLDRVAETSYQSDLGNWQNCVDRNTRARAGLAQFRTLVKAHARDGNTAASKAWKRYLASQSKYKLPSCGPMPKRVPPEPIATNPGGSP